MTKILIRLVNILLLFIAIVVSQPAWALRIDNPSDWSEYTETTNVVYGESMTLGDNVRDYDEIWSKETFGPGQKVQFDIRLPFTSLGYNRIGFLESYQPGSAVFWIGTRWEAPNQLEFHIRYINESGSSTDYTQFVSNIVTDGNFVVGNIILDWKSDGSMSASYNDVVFFNNSDISITKPMHFVARAYERPMEISNFSHTSSSSGSFKVTDVTYDKNDDLNSICQQHFGQSYRLADWSSDIVPLFNNGTSPDDILAEGHAFVSNNGKEFWNGDRHYIASRNNHNPHPGYLSHDDLDNHLFDLGSWTSNYRILCYPDEVQHPISTLTIQAPTNAVKLIIKAKTMKGWEFVEWDGQCQGKKKKPRKTVVNMNQDKECLVVVGQ